MKEKVADEVDGLRSHYDLKSLRVRKLGPGRMKFGTTTPEERHREIRENAEAGVTEYRKGKQESFSNIDDLMDYLAHD